MNSTRIIHMFSMLAAGEIASNLYSYIHMTNGLEFVLSSL